MPLSRSEQMARIKGRDTTPEVLLRKALWKAGLRYRLHYRTPAGRPDVVFPGARTALFVDGCQWHGCPDHYVRPRTRGKFWAEKLRSNVDRDRRQTLELSRLGWSVVRVWEHEIFEDIGGLVSMIQQVVSRRYPVRPATDWRVVRVEALDESGTMERRHMESLETPDRTKAVEGPRSTKKWARK